MSIRAMCHVLKAHGAYITTYLILKLVYKYGPTCVKQHMEVEKGKTIIKPWDNYISDI